MDNVEQVDKAANGTGMDEQPDSPFPPPMESNVDDYGDEIEELISDDEDEEYVDDEDAEFYDEEHDENYANAEEELIVLSDDEEKSDKGRKTNGTKPKLTTVVTAVESDDDKSKGEVGLQEVPTENFSQPIAPEMAEQNGTERKENGFEKGADMPPALGLATDGHTNELPPPLTRIVQEDYGYKEEPKVQPIAEYIEDHRSTKSVPVNTVNPSVHFSLNPEPETVFFANVGISEPTASAATVPDAAPIVPDDQMANGKGKNEEQVLLSPEGASKLTEETKNIQIVLDSVVKVTESTRPVRQVNSAKKLQPSSDKIEPSDDHSHRKSDRSKSTPVKFGITGESDTSDFGSPMSLPRYEKVKKLLIRYYVDGQKPKENQEQVFQCEFCLRDYVWFRSICKHYEQDKCPAFSLHTGKRKPGFVLGQYCKSPKAVSPKPKSKPKPKDTFLTPNSAKVSKAAKRTSDRASPVDDNSVRKSGRVKRKKGNEDFVEFSEQSGEQSDSGHDGSGSGSSLPKPTPENPHSRLEEPSTSTSTPTIAHEPAPVPVPVPVAIDLPTQESPIGQKSEKKRGRGRPKKSDTPTQKRDTPSSRPKRSAKPPTPAVAAPIKRPRMANVQVQTEGTQDPPFVVPHLPPFQPEVAKDLKVTLPDGNQRFVCNFCGNMSFRGLASLVDHKSSDCVDRRKFLGVLYFECPLCITIGFLDMNDVRHHLEQNHFGGVSSTH